MELVYLWIEDYKNIHHQGFNFSPRFTCRYDEVKQELTIDKKDDYVSIFPPNINVTTIVGENGSGKSSVSELLVKFSYQEFHDKKTFLMYFDGTTFSFKQASTDKDLKFKVLNNTKYKNDTVNKMRTVDCIYFSNDVASFFNNPKFNNSQTYSNLDAYYNYDTNLMENNNYPYTSREQTNKLETFNARFKEILEKDKNILIDISKNLIFDSFRRELHFYEIGAIFHTNGEGENLCDLLNVKKLESSTIFNNITDEKIHFYKLLILFRLFKIENSNQKTIISLVKQDFRKKEIDLDVCLGILKQFNEYDKLENIYTKENIEDILNKYTYSKDEIWIEKNSNDIKDNFETFNELLNTILKTSITRINFLNTLSPGYDYFSLSSGEREYIKTFVALIFHLKKESKEFIFIFDEIELGLHPNWQKKLIQDFVIITSKYIKKSMNFIFTSHSPFILSDIPKENVIFLKKGEDGNCKNVTKETNIETFGANIHTLLSHGFFMKDGLMGEFAKGKINEIKEFYDKVKKSKNPQKTYLKKYNENKKDFENIQRIIGEPFLKTIMKNYLDELEILFHGKKEFLDKEINRLEKLRESLDDKA